MQPQNGYNSENDFLDQLTGEIDKSANLEWRKTTFDAGADLIVRDKDTGKTALIEFKTGGQYGELPISSIIALSNISRNNKDLQKIFLITFSQISAMLSAKLKELNNVKTITQPANAGQVVHEVQLALSA